MGNADDTSPFDGVPDEDPSSGVLGQHLQKPASASATEIGVENLGPLTPKQKVFAAEYLVDFCGLKSAVRAGYSPASAGMIATALLKKANVAAYIEKLKAQRESRVNVTADSVLHEMSLLANSSLEHYYIDDNGHVQPTEDAPEGAMRAIQSMKRRKIVRESHDGELTITYETEVKLWDKPNSLKLMGRHVNLFPNRVEVTGKGGEPIELAHLTVDQLQAKAKELAEIAGQITDGEIVKD